MAWLRCSPLFLLLACGADAGGDASASAGGSSSSGGTGSSSTHDTTADSGDTHGSSDATVDPTRGTTTFDDTPDIGCFASQCDVWAQDCNEGQKCVPWSANGDGTFGGCADARCSDVAPTTVGPGEPCTLDGGPYSGVDDCALGSYCWASDPKTGAGVCVGQCLGTEDAPLCEGELTCFAMQGTSVTACVPSCDPLAPACAAGTTCTLSTSSDFGPLCLAVDLGVVQEVGMPCDLRIGCGDGLACLPAEAVADCNGAGCCASLCELSEQTCPADTACTAIAAAPMGVGACAAA